MSPKIPCTRCKKNPVEFSMSEFAPKEYICDECLEEEKLGEISKSIMSDLVQSKIIEVHAQSLPSELRNLINKNKDILNYVLAGELQKEGPHSFVKLRIDFEDRGEAIRNLEIEKLILHSSMGNGVVLNFVGFIFCDSPDAKALFEVAKKLYAALRETFKRTEGKQDESLKDLVKRVYAPPHDLSDRYEAVIKVLDYFNRTPFYIVTLNTNTMYDNPSSGHPIVRGGNQMIDIKNFDTLVSKSCKFLAEEYATRHSQSLSVPQSREEALSIANDFQKYIRQGDKSYIEKYTKEQVKCALSFIPNSKRNHQWYKEMEKYIEKPDEGEKNRKDTTMTSDEHWLLIDKEYGITKRAFANKMSFVKDAFKRKIIFRDVEQACLLAKTRNFSKPAVILAGSVIEELLRLYLESKTITLVKDDFDGYIKTCENHKLLKSAIHRLSDSIRQFRNLVHLKKEATLRDTISMATAQGAVASIFTIVNDF